jgi:hypothetical protein
MPLVLPDKCGGEEPAGGAPHGDRPHLLTHGGERCAAVKCPEERRQAEVLLKRRFPQLAEKVEGGKLALLLYVRIAEPVRPRRRVGVALATVCARSLAL